MGITTAPSADNKNPESPEYWEGKVRGWYAYSEDALEDYLKYCKWYAGDMSSIAADIRRQTRTKAHVLTNLLNLVVRTSRAELFFRCPRFFVKPIETFGSSIFTSKLAKMETALLNQTASEVGLFTEGRRVIEDMLLGPFGVFKVGYSGEVAIDANFVDAETELAHQEDLMLVTQGKKPKVKEDDYHAGHIETHGMTLAAIERGDIQVPAKTKDYLVKHIKMHEKYREQYGERPKETIRNEHVFVRRRSPLRVFFDPWAESPSERDWVGEVLIRRREDVENDDRYDFEARHELNNISATEVTHYREYTERFEMLKSGYDQDEHVLIYEIVDLRKRKVITYAQGAKKALRVVDYNLFSILPGGPYIDASFNYDPVTDLGICPPNAYESHQVTASLLETVATISARRAVPSMVVAGDFLDQADIDKIRSGIPAGLHVLKNLRTGMKIEEVLQQMPTVDIPDQLLIMIDRHKRSIEQLSGIGSAKLAGGDTANTATASAIIGESTTTLSEDLASVIDDLMSRLGKIIVRLLRRFYSAARVAELIGDEALDEGAWPVEWTDRDILNDRGVFVVPGSSQRNSTAVENKLGMELYSILLTDPVFQMMPGPRIEVLKRIFENSGWYDIDLDGMQAALEEQKQAEEAAAAQAEAEGQGGEGSEKAPGAPGSPQGADPASRPLRRVGTGSEPSNASAIQGANNPGAGRVASGASVGDKVSMMRGKAVNKIANRG